MVGKFPSVGEKRLFISVEAANIHTNEAFSHVYPFKRLFLFMLITVYAEQ
jgi:hypothetical protein